MLSKSNLNLEKLKDLFVKSCQNFLKNKFKYNSTFVSIKKPNPTETSSKYPQKVNHKSFSLILKHKNPKILFFFFM